GAASQATVEPHPGAAPDADLDVAGDRSDVHRAGTNLVQGDVARPDGDDRRARQPAEADVAGRAAHRGTGAHRADVDVTGRPLESEVSADRSTFDVAARAGEVDIAAHVLEAQVAG